MFTKVGKILDCICVLLIAFFTSSAAKGHPIKWFNINKNQRDFKLDDCFITNENGTFDIYISNQRIGRYPTLLESMKIFYKYVGRCNYFLTYFEIKIFPCIKISSVALFQHILSGMLGYHVDRNNGYREINHRINSRIVYLDDIESASSIITRNYRSFING